MARSKTLRFLAVGFVIIGLVVGFTAPHITASPGQSIQSAQTSAAYAAAFWLWTRGGYNGVNVIVTNLGNHPVKLCLSDWYNNGTEIITALCSKNAAASGGQAWWRLLFQYVGYSGTIVVYSQDGSTPIAPFGYVTVDQNSNKIVDTMVGLQWIPVSAP